MSLFIPPSAICYYHNHNVYAHQLADMDTHLRVTLFAVPIFVGFGSQAADRTTGYFKEIKRYIELNKTFCRRVMGNNPVVFTIHPMPALIMVQPGVYWNMRGRTAPVVMQACSN